MPFGLRRLKSQISAARRKMSDDCLWMLQDTGLCTSPEDEKWFQIVWRQGAPDIICIIAGGYSIVLVSLLPVNTIRIFSMRFRWRIVEKRSTARRLLPLIAEVSCVVLSYTRILSLAKMVARS